MKIAVISCEDTNISISEQKGVCCEFIQVTDIVRCEEDRFDFYLVLSRDKLKSEEVARELETKISSKKILEYTKFVKNPDISPIELFWQHYSHKKYERFVFGMSHSHGGLIERFLKEKTYKFSAPSMDLYYYLLVLKDVCKNYDMSSVKQIVFEIPYYVFNFDVSKCKKTFVQRINFYHYYGDYHHYGETDLESEEIIKYKKLCEILGRNEGGEKYTSKENVFKEILKRWYLRLKYVVDQKSTYHTWSEPEIKAVTENCPHVWDKVYEDTYVENRKIWNQILDLLAEYPNVQVKVCVFPFCKYFRDTHSEQIEKNKKVFYENINIPKKDIFDYFELFAEKENYFSDYCHLNSQGAYHLSNIIKKELRINRGKI